MATKTGDELTSWCTRFSLLSAFVSRVVLAAIASVVVTVPSLADVPLDPFSEAKRLDIPLDQSIYIQLQDGTKIAADIALPDLVRQGQKVPSMFRATRYWRSTQMKPAQELRHPLIEGFVQAGYAVVSIDVRGTGASFGHRDNEFTAVETRDLAEAIEWISQQSWSNGAVASLGVSYEGNTAENAGLVSSSALKATIPMFTDFDLFTSILFPGGLPNQLILREWAHSTAQMDRNEVDSVSSETVRDTPIAIGVKPVDADTDSQVLVAAVAEHKTNQGVADIFSKVIFRDDVVWATHIDAPAHAMISAHIFRKRAEQQQVPAYHWGSWVDAGTAAGVIARFASFDAPARYVVGAWNHGADRSADPYQAAGPAAQPSVAEQYSSVLDFLAPLTKGRKPHLSPAKQLFYYTMGENSWKQTTVWPPKGSTQKRFYLGENNSLRGAAPVVPESATDYQVDFSHGSGKASRWTTQLGGGAVDYGDRRHADRNLLSFTTEPFDQAVEITGHPVVQLQMTATNEDGAVIVYLQDVAPDGTVRMVTQGQLRLLHRKVSSAKPPYPVFGPYHSFRREDASPMEPGKISSVAFAMLPTSVLIKKGHALRIAIAGHDKDVFARIPAKGSQVYQIEHNLKHQSYIDIPVVMQYDGGQSTHFVDLIKEYN